MGRLLATVSDPRGPQLLGVLAVLTSATEHVDFAPAMTRHLGHTVEVIPETDAALERALELAAPEDVVFATGSLYLVGDLRRHWEARPQGLLPDAARRLAAH